MTWQMTALGGAHEGKADEHTDHSAHSQDAGMDHSAHTGHSTERDAEGRRLYGMKHQITPEVADELRTKVRGWQNISDQEIALSMSMMGSNYEWYISDENVKGDTGVLILLHGFKERGDKMFVSQVQSYADIVPFALSFGMSMMMSDHIQLALDDLTAAGAKNIVVIPIVSTEYNTMIRQWQYIFGLRDEASYAAVAQVKTDADVIFVDPPNDDPAVAEILLDHALELSTDPASEVVIIASHGPSEDLDNQQQLKLMENMAAIVEEDGGFSAVYGLTLQDDAPKEIRAANVEKLRAKVETSTADGKKVIVVTNLIGSRTIQAKLRKDLEGLDYSFNAKGISQHENFLDWIGETVRVEVESINRSAANLD